MRIRISNIKKSFGEKEVLRGIDFEFLAGKINMIIGASGSGKSVMLKCIVGLMQPDEGEVWYGDVNFHQGDHREIRKIRTQMGMLFQYSALFDSFTVAENIGFPMRMFTTMSSAEIKKRVEFCLDRVNLQGVESNYPAELSGGMQKRVGIARAIALNPTYLFVDEPNSGLDPLTASVIDELIQDLTQEYNMTTVVVSHDMNSVVNISDRIMFLHHGVKAWEGDKRSILRSGNEEVDKFVFVSDLIRRDIYDEDDQNAISAGTVTRPPRPDYIPPADIRKGGEIEVSPPLEETATEESNETPLPEPPPALTDIHPEAAENLLEAVEEETTLAPDPTPESESLPKPPTVDTADPSDHEEDGPEEEMEIDSDPEDSQTPEESSSEPPIKESADPSEHEEEEDGPEEEKEIDSDPEDFQSLEESYSKPPTEESADPSDHEEEEDMPEEEMEVDSDPEDFQTPEESSSELPVEETAEDAENEEETEPDTEVDESSDLEDSSTSEESSPEPPHLETAESSGGSNDPEKNDGADTDLSAPKPLLESSASSSVDATSHYPDWLKAELSRRQEDADETENEVAEETETPPEEAEDPASKPEKSKKDKKKKEKGKKKKKKKKKSD